MNGDLQFQPGEQSGTPIVTSATSTLYASDYKRPYTNEVTAGIDQLISGDVRLATVFTNRSERYPTAYVNTALPNSAWPARTTIDPGRDGVVGTADDSTITTYNRTVAATQILINADPTFVQTYKGLEITATKRMSKHWQMLAGITFSQARQTDQSEAMNTTQLNWGPNALINTTGPISADVPVQFKLTGTYVLPWDIAIAANFRSQSDPAQPPVERALDTRGQRDGERRTIQQRARPCSDDPRSSGIKAPAVRATEAQRALRGIECHQCEHGLVGSDVDRCEYLPSRRESNRAHERRAAGRNPDEHSGAADCARRGD